LLVAHERRIGGNHQSKCRKAIRSCDPVLAVMQKCPHARQKFLRFPTPVFNKRCRTNHKSRPRARPGPAAPPNRLAQAESLECFSQSHFVSKDSRQTVAVKVQHPSDTNFLIQPKLLVDLFRKRRRGKLRYISKRFRSLPPSRRRLKPGQE